MAPVTAAQIFGPGTFKAFKSDRAHLRFHCGFCDKAHGRPDEMQRHVKLSHPVQWAAMKGSMDYKDTTVWQKDKVTGKETRISARKYRALIWRGKKRPRSNPNGGNRRAATGRRVVTNANFPGGLQVGDTVKKAALLLAKARKLTRDLAAQAAEKDEEDEDEEMDDEKESEDEDDDDENDADYEE